MNTLRRQMEAQTGQRIFYAAKDRAGITKQCGILRHQHLLALRRQSAHPGAPGREPALRVCGFRAQGLWSGRYHAGEIADDASCRR